MHTRTMRGQNLGILFPLILATLLGLACGSDHEPSQPPDAASLDPYFQDCSLADDTCPAPYVCTPTQDSHEPDGGLSEVCLVPCDEAADCSFHASCCCKGVDCQSDTGTDGFCVCV